MAGLPTRRSLSQTPPVQAGILLGVGFALAAALVWAVTELRTLLIVLVVAGFLAIGMNRPVSLMTRRGLPRWLAVMILIFSLFLLICGGIGLIIPIVVREGTEFIQAAPGYWEDLMSSSLLERFGGETRILEQAQSFLTGENISNALGGFLGGVATAAGAIGWFTTCVILALFILGGHDRIRGGALRLVAASKRDRAAELLDQILQQVGAYLIGALAIAVVAGASSWIFMAIVGIPYAAILAVVVAISDLIPQIGATIGAIIVTLVALTVSPTTALISVIFFLLYQQLENWLIYPTVMRSAVKVSDLASIVSVLIGAALFGVIGVILAIPFYAAVRLIIRELVFPRLDES
ncbi:AI-2E family transporter [Glycomyces tenuis]|uniref:AI-2E family transporter n=3 Tax=Glycomyces tenuis TaxID=58116 RepID=UPI0009DB7437|nr:AI-2E family transporter [Glycomyces tenuis]